MTTYPPKITFGEMRESGVRNVLIYCRDHLCSHHVETCADPVCVPLLSRQAITQAAGYYWDVG
jgi:hypothetical protein